MQRALRASCSVGARVASVASPVPRLPQGGEVLARPLYVKVKAGNGEVSSRPRHVAARLP